MSTLALKNFPSEIALEIFQYLTSFYDLKTLILSSPVFYKPFNTYTIPAITPIAEHILEGVWNDATTVLVYQRHTNPKGIITSHATLQKDLESKFTIRKSDISHLTTNQRFYDSCAEDFSAFAAVYFKTTGGSTPSSTWSANSTFTTNSTLSMQLFYTMWLLGLCFHYESVLTFSQREPLTAGQLADFRIVAHVMHHNKYFKDIIRLPKWKYKVCERALVGGLFDAWGDIGRPWMNTFDEDGSDRSLLMLKLMAHSKVAADRRWERGCEAGIASTLLRCAPGVHWIERGYDTMSLEDRVKKHRLDEGWE